jgi:hypothetical protein
MLDVFFALAYQDFQPRLKTTRLDLDSSAADHDFVPFAILFLQQKRWPWPF